MFPVASPTVVNVAQPSPTDSARSPSACAGAAIAHRITGNSPVVPEVQATKPLNCATSPNAVAAKEDKKDQKVAPSKATPGFDPKPVQLGGESLADRLLPHMKKIVWGVVGIVLIIIVVYTFKIIKERGRKKDSAKIAAVLEVGERQVRPAGVEPDPAAKEPTFATNKERAEAVLDAITKQGARVPSNYRASLQLQAGKIDDAIAEYRKSEKLTTLDGVLAREGLGIALESKAQAEQDSAVRQKGFEEALAVFQAMQPDEAGPRRAYALYHQGRMLGPRLLGKPAEAKAILEKAKELGKDPELATLIDEQLASLGAS